MPSAALGDEGDWGTPNSAVPNGRLAQLSHARRARTVDSPARRDRWFQFAAKLWQMAALVDFRSSGREEIALQPKPVLRDLHQDVSGILSWMAHKFNDDSTLHGSMIHEDAAEFAFSGPECSMVGDELDQQERRARNTALAMEAGALDISSGIELAQRLADSARRATTGPSLFHARVAVLRDLLQPIAVSQVQFSQSILPSNCCPCLHLLVDWASKMTGWKDHCGLPPHGAMARLGLTCLATFQGRSNDIPRSIPVIWGGKLPLDPSGIWIIGCCECSNHSFGMLALAGKLRWHGYS